MRLLHLAAFHSGVMTLGVAAFRRHFATSTLALGTLACHGGGGSEARLSRGRARRQRARGATAGTALALTL